MWFARYLFLRMNDFLGFRGVFVFCLLIWMCGFVFIDLECIKVLSFSRFDVTFTVGLIFPLFFFLGVSIESTWYC